MMILMVVLSVVLLIFSLFTLKPSASVVKVGYGDIGRYQGGEWSSMTNAGGYHDGSFLEMLAYPVLAILFGVIHNILITKVWEKRGSGLARALAYVTLMLILVTFVVLIRLLGEG